MKNLTTKTNRWMYFSASHQFCMACAEFSTRKYYSLGECASLDAMQTADAYLMGGEL